MSEKRNHILTTRCQDCGKPLGHDTRHPMKECTQRIREQAENARDIAEEVMREDWEDRE